VLNPPKFLPLIDRAKEADGARQVLALLPRVLQLMVSEGQGAMVTQVSRESAAHLTAFASRLRDNAPLQWQRVPEHVYLGRKKPRVRDYRDQTAVPLHDRPRNVKGDPYGRVQIALLGSVAGKKPGLNRTFAELEYRQLGDVHWGHQYAFGGSVIRNNVWRLVFDGVVALATAWVDRLGDAELDQLILDAKNLLLIHEVMES
jgi:hypothetical protein